MKTILKIHENALSIITYLIFAYPIYFLVSHFIFREHRPFFSMTNLIGCIMCYGWSLVFDFVEKIIKKRKAINLLNKSTKATLS